MCAQDTRASLVLADDHKAFLDACKHLLQPEFEVVATARSGQEALDAVAEHVPDILILDISMPDMTGVEVLEALADRAVSTRVVVSTIHQERSLADRAAALGAYGFVTKARMARDLPAAIRAALAGELFRSPLAP